MLWSSFDWNLKYIYFDMLHAYLTLYHLSSQLNCDTIIWGWEWEGEHGMQNAYIHFSISTLPIPLYVIIIKRIFFIIRCFVSGAIPTYTAFQTYAAEGRWFSLTWCLLGILSILVFYFCVVDFEHLDHYHRGKSLFFNLMCSSRLFQLKNCSALSAKKKHLTDRLIRDNQLPTPSFQISWLHFSSFLLLNVWNRICRKILRANP